MYAQNIYVSRAHSDFNTTRETWAKEIVAGIELVTQEKIVPGKTLLFLDEVQACPRAITGLRYFKEQLPELHVVSAGSLLEFVVHEGDFSFPVGRVEFLYLYPFSFAEFLTALGYDKLADELVIVDPAHPLPEVVHEKALQLVRQYLLIGGMPAAIQTFIDSGSFLDAQRVQANLLQTYESDFGKYAKAAKIPYLHRLFRSAPNVVGGRFRYKSIDPDVRSRELKAALELLCRAGLVRQVRAVHANGLPIPAEASDRKFKLLLLDVGLYQRAMRVDSEVIWKQEILQINEGSLAEQFVGQELVAHHDAYEPAELFYWKRSKTGSAAEIDYLVQMEARLVPIEVKAGGTGRMRSLRMFMEQKSCPLGVRISQRPIALEDSILSVPLYMVEQIGRLLANT